MAATPFLLWLIGDVEHTPVAFTSLSFFSFCLYVSPIYSGGTNPLVDCAICEKEKKKKKKKKIWNQVDC